jgi:hypothetical protein
MSREQSTHDIFKIYIYKFGSRSENYACLPLGVTEDELDIKNNIEVIV